MQCFFFCDTVQCNRVAGDLMTSHSMRCWFFAMQCNAMGFLVRCVVYPGNTSACRGSRGEILSWLVMLTHRALTKRTHYWPCLGLGLPLGGCRPVMDRLEVLSGLRLLMSFIYLSVGMPHHSAGCNPFTKRQRRSFVGCLFVIVSLLWLLLLSHKPILFHYTWMPQKKRKEKKER